MIDGTGGSPVEDAVVLVQGERIIKAGHRESVAIPQDAEIIDVQGGTILPGFINAHVHGGYDRERLKAWHRPRCRL